MMRKWQHDEDVPAPDEEVPVAGDANVVIPAFIVTPVLIHQAVVRHGLGTEGAKTTQMICLLYLIYLKPSPALPQAKENL